MRRDTCRLNLGRHATAANIRARLPGHRENIAAYCTNFGDMSRTGVCAGVRRIKAIDIGQQYQRIGHDQLRDPGIDIIEQGQHPFTGGYLFAQLAGLDKCS